MSDIGKAISALSANQNWLSVDREIGIGSAVVDATAQTYFGRESRVALIAVVSDGVTKIVRCLQNGTARLSALPNNLRFSQDGGTRTVVISTNADSINAILYSTESNIRSLIDTAVINGQSVDIQDTMLIAGIPMDPGAREIFEISLVISMPVNKDHEQKTEKLVLNDKITINIIQEASTSAYINVDPENITIGSGGGQGVVNIESNTEYDIEIIECHNPCAEFSVFPASVSLDTSGASKTVSVTARDGLTWGVQ